MKQQSNGGVWVKDRMPPKPGKWPENYYCIIDSGTGTYKRTALLGCHGDWIDDSKIIAWLDESTPPASYTREDYDVIERLIEALTEVDADSAWFSLSEDTRDFVNAALNLPEILEFVSKITAKPPPAESPVVGEKELHPLEKPLAEAWENEGNRWDKFASIEDPKPSQGEDKVPPGVIALISPISGKIDYKNLRNLKRSYEEWVSTGLNIGLLIHTIEVDGIQWSVRDETTDGTINKFSYDYNRWFAHTTKWEVGVDIGFLIKLPPQPSEGTGKGEEPQDIPHLQNKVTSLECEIEYLKAKLKSGEGDLVKALEEWIKWSTADSPSSLTYLCNQSIAALTNHRNKSK